MKAIYLLIAMVFTFVSVNAQETETLSEFDQLDVAGPFKVRLIKSDEPKIRIDRKGFSKNELEIVNRAGSLSLRVRPKGFIDTDFDDKDFMEIDIYFTELEEVKGSMGAQIESEDVIKNNFIVLEVSMGASLKLSIEAKEIDVKVVMGGEAEVEGKAQRGYFSTNMGGEIHARDLLVEEADVKVNMGGIIFVSVGNKINANANLGGVINYYGDPQIVNTAISLGGEIRKRSTVN